MSFVKTGRSLMDVGEEELVPEGQYDLRIFATRESKSQSGRDTTIVSIQVEDPNHPNAQPITHVLTIPSDEDWDENPQMATTFMRRNRRFLELFKIPYSEDGWDTEDFPGQTARAFVSQTKEDNEGNVYNRIRVPKFS